MNTMKTPYRLLLSLSERERTILEQFALEHNVSMASVLRWLINEYLPRQKENANEKSNNR